MFASAMRAKSCDAFDLAYDRTAEIPSLARAETIPQDVIEDDDGLVEIEIVVEEPEEQLELPDDEKIYLATLITATSKLDKAMLCRCLAHILNRYRDNDDLAMAARRFFFEMAAKFDQE